METVKVGLIIPTRDRPDFVIRQLDYYAAVRCPHHIYIVDSSSQEKAQKLQHHAEWLRDKLRIDYFTYPPGPDCFQFVIPLVKEQYVTYCGDDDYQIPDSITQCAQFLEEHPDYNTATGYAVTFQLKNSGNGVYGELGSLSDYPRPPIEANTASERVIDYFSRYFVTEFSVRRTEMAKKIFQGTNVKDRAFGTEIFRCTLDIVFGKSKTVDCLGFVRQMHQSHYELIRNVEWITSEHWRESYLQFRDRVAQEIAVQDKIPLDEALEVTKRAFWIYLQRHLAKDYREKYAQEKKKNAVQLLSGKLRPVFTRAIPILKTFYRSWIKKPSIGSKDLHFKVLQKSSPYYKDFKPVMDSFTSKLP